MEDTGPSLDADRKIRRVRVSQAALVTAGVVAGVLPALAQNDAFPLSVVAYTASLLLVPLAYGVFASAVERAVAALLPPETTRRTPVLFFALFVGTPCIGGLLEILLLHRLTSSTARLEGARNHAHLVVVLAILRGAAVWLSALLVGLAAMGGQASLIALYAVGPIVSFGILGVITQIIVTPLLDQLLPSRSAVRLAGASASSSMAVPSSSGERG